MDIVKRGNQGAMLLSTASMEERSLNASKESSDAEETRDEGSSSNSNNSTWQEEGAKEVSNLKAKMKSATTLLRLDSEDEESDDSDYGEDDQSIRSGDLDLELSEYNNEALEVSSGEFDAKFVKRYANPATFLHALWNTAGPSVGAMRIFLDILLEELNGMLIGVQPEFKDVPEEVIKLMYQEGGDQPADTIAFISKIQEEIAAFDDNEEDSFSHIKNIQYGDPDPAPDIPTEDGGTHEASKTHGSLPGAHQTSPVDGTVIEPASAAGGDKEGMQTMSMAGGE